MDKKRLLILGAGQYSFVVEDVARDMKEFDVISFLDDNSERAIGKLQDLENLKEEYSFGIVAIGDSKIREMLTVRLKELGFEIPCLIHPSAVVSNSATLGRGVVVEANSVIQANAVIGDGSIISSGAIIRHNGIVGSYCHCDCNAVVLSGAVVSDYTKIKCGEIY